MSAALVAAAHAELLAGNMTRLEFLVLRALPTFRPYGGLLFPSHAAIARRVGCHTATVGRALNNARALGLLTWMRRRRRVGKWRTEQTSNLYILLKPAPDRPTATARGCPWPRRRSDQQDRTTKVLEIKKEAQEPLPWDAIAAERRMLAYLGAQKAATQARMGSGGRPSS
jgi:hypothetical protein